jgi:hypothetical protein
MMLSQRIASLAVERGIGGDGVCRGPGGCWDWCVGRQAGRRRGARCKRREREGGTPRPGRGASLDYGLCVGHRPQRQRVDPAPLRRLARREARLLLLQRRPRGGVRREAPQHARERGAAGVVAGCTWGGAGAVRHQARRTSLPEAQRQRPPPTLGQPPPAGPPTEEKDDDLILTLLVGQPGAAAAGRRAGRRVAVLAAAPTPAGFSPANHGTQRTAAQRPQLAPAALP